MFREMSSFESSEPHTHSEQEVEVAPPEALKALREEAEPRIGQYTKEQEELLRNAVQQAMNS